MANVFATLRQGVSAMPRLHFSRPTNVVLCILKIVRAFHPGAARNIPRRVTVHGPILVFSGMR